MVLSWLFNVAFGASTPATPALCDVAALTAAVAVPPTKAADVLHWAAATLGASCTLPGGIAKALPEIATLKPDHRRQVDLMTASDEPKLMAAACPAGPGVAVDISFAKSAVDARKLVFKQCDLVRFGWYTEEEFANATGALVNGVLVSHVLQVDGVPDAVARPLARAVVGLFDPPPPLPVP